MNCKNCGVEIESSTEFCPSCGTKVDTVAEVFGEEKGTFVETSTFPGDEKVEKVAEEKVVNVEEVVPEPVTVAPQPEPAPVSASPVEPVQAQPQPVQQPVQPQPVQAQPMQPQPEQPRQGQMPQDQGPVVEKTDKPMTVMGWILTFFLLSIPVINIIMILVWAFSRKTNTSKRTFIQASLIWTLLLIGLGIVISVVVGVFFQEALLPVIDSILNSF